MAITLDSTAAQFKTGIGLGTAAELDVGTAANNVVQLDGSGNLPAAQADQLTGVATGNEYFTGHITTNTSVAQGTYHQFTSTINFGVVSDTLSAWNNTTGRYTPNQAGWYYITVRIHPDCGGAQFINSFLDILKNTDLHHRTEQNELTANANEHTSTCSTIIQLNGTTDYIEPKFWIGDSSGSPLMYGGDYSNALQARTNSINIWRLGA